jgi:flagellar biogenesis protein FliO
MNSAGQSVAAGSIEVLTPCSRGEAEAVQGSGAFRRIVNSLLMLLKSVKVQRRKRQMFLCETLPLGEKRFLAIVEINQEKLLIAATDHSISLLQRLDDGHPPIQAESEKANSRFAEGWR